MSHPSPDTEDLIRRAAEGDDDAFRTLVRRVHPRLTRWALAKTGDPDDADEAVQRTLIRMHGGLGGFSGDATLGSWLYRILSNVVIDMHRAASARPTAREEEETVEERREEPDPVRTIHADRLVRAVRDFFDTLPPRQREVLELVDHQGMKAVEVAEMLEIEPVSVRASLFKARRTLRTEIVKRYPELTEGYGT